MEKILPAAILLLVILPAAFANSAPAINSLAEKSGSTSKREGYLYEFEVDASDAEGDSIYYSWNFGDSSEWLETTEPRAGHNYYFDAGTGESTAEFTVTVNASDGEFQASASLEVEVSKDYWKARLLEPGPVETLPKNSEVPVKIEVLNRANTPQSTGTINADVKIGGEAVEVEKEEKYFSAAIPAGYSHDNMELLEVKIERGSSKSENVFPLYFKPAEIGVKGSPLEEKSLHIGSSIGELNVFLEFGDGEVPLEGDFRAGFFSGTEMVAEAALERKLDFYTAEIDYAIKVEDYFNGLELRLEGKDSHGNVLESQAFPVEMQKDNPGFNIVILKPDLSVSGSFGYGQEIELVASYESDGEPGSASMSYQSPGGEPYSLSGLEREFSALVKLPEAGAEAYSIVVFGTAKIGGVEVSDFEILELKLSNQLEIEFIYPAEGSTALQGDGKALIVSIRYPGGRALEKDSFKAVLYIDNERKVITLKKDPATGNYSFGLDEPLTGQHSLKLVLPETGDMSGSAEIATNIAAGFDFLGILLFVLLLAGLGCAGYFVLRRFRAPGAELKAQITKAPAKPKAAAGYFKDEMKKLEIEFYKRKISEEEFRKKMVGMQRMARRAEERAGIPKTRPAAAALPEITVPPAQGTRGEERLKTAIEKRVKGGEGLHPLIIGKDVKARPKMPEAIKAPRPPEKLLEKPRETLSEKKRADVRERLGKISKKEGVKGALTAREEEAVEKLVPMLKSKASAFTREEIFNSIIEEGFSASVAREVVKSLFGGQET